MRVVYYCAIFSVVVLMCGCYSDGCNRHQKNIPLVVGETSVAKIVSCPRPIEAICIFRNSPALEKSGQFTIHAERGKALELRYLLGVLSNDGLFVVHSNRFARVDVPVDAGWDVVNDKGVNLGRIFIDRDNPLTRELNFVNESDLKWKYYPGRASDAVRGNKLSSEVLHSGSVLIPFDQLDYDGEWGSVTIPMSAFVRFYDLGRKKFQEHKQTWDLKIVFQGRSEDKRSLIPSEIE